MHIKPLYKSSLLPYHWLRQSHLSTQNQSVEKYTSRGQANYIAKLTTSIEQRTIIFTWSMCEWVRDMGQWVFTEQYYSWYNLQEEWGKKCKYDAGNHGGRSQFYFYTMYHVFKLVHRLLLVKWHSNPPSVMAKTFVCQCHVTLEWHSIHLWARWCMGKQWIPGHVPFGTHPST